MPHVSLSTDAPGIIGLLNEFPHSEKPINHLCQAVMRGDASLSLAERELIATHVSAGNECRFCRESHAATARHLLGDQCHLVTGMIDHPEDPPMDAKMRALLHIAGKVRIDGKLVTTDDVAAARQAGADDRAIHDTVLIAAMFCMFNRYVDGLGTIQPDDSTVYEVIGERIATKGYGSRYRDPSQHG
ncbi:MAG: carboxymuconolactone decarboxylase family protein [Planctomycetia bacterium]|nr:carboxymuconolactone decarboxylase family protein [Planctomycetia bacterium]